MPLEQVMTHTHTHYSPKKCNDSTSWARRGTLGLVHIWPLGAIPVLCVQKDSVSKATMVVGFAAVCLCETKRQGLPKNSLVDVDA